MTHLRVLLMTWCLAGCGVPRGRPQHTARDLGDSSPDGPAATSPSARDGIALLAFVPDDVSAAALIRDEPARPSRLPAWVGPVLEERFRRVLPEAALTLAAGTIRSVWAATLQFPPEVARTARALVVFRLGDQDCLLVRTGGASDILADPERRYAAATPMEGFLFHPPNPELLAAGLRNGDPAVLQLVEHFPGVLVLDERTFAFVRPELAPILAERIRNRSGAPSNLRDALGRARGSLTMITMDPDATIARMTLELVSHPQMQEGVERIGVDLTVVPRIGHGDVLVQRLGGALGSNHVRVRGDLVLAGTILEQTEPRRH